MKNIIFFYLRNLIIILLFCLFVESIFPDLIFLEDGTVHYGEIVKLTNTKIYFRKEDENKKKAYTRKNILRIMYKEGQLRKQYVYKKDGTYVHGFIVEEDEHKIVIRKVLQERKEISLLKKNISSISEKKLSKKSLFYIFKLPLADNIKSASIEGDFTSWQPAQMVRNKNNWEKNIEIDILKKNEYEYRYIFNNKPASKRFIKFKVKDGKLVEDIDLFRFGLGLRAGGGFFISGMAKKIRPRQPVFSVTGRINLRLLWEKLTLQPEIIYYNSEPITKKNPLIKDLTVGLENYFFCGFLLLDINIFDAFSIHPKIGGGYVFRNIKVSGKEKGNYTNRNYFIGGGLEFSYKINKFLSAVLFYNVMPELKHKNTIVNISGLGVNFSL
jgi:hypothetical protein